MTRRNETESKKTQKKEVDLLVPLCSSQKKCIIKTKIESLVKKKKLTLIIQLGWFVNMVIRITFRMEGRRSRWKPH